MDKNLQNIEHSFFTDLDGYEEMPTEKVWEAIDKQLDKDNILIITRKYLIVKRLAVVLMFFLLAIVLIEINGGFKNISLSQKTKSFNNISNFSELVDLSVTDKSINTEVKKNNKNKHNFSFPLNHKDDKKLVIQQKVSPITVSVLSPGKGLDNKTYYKKEQAFILLNKKIKKEVLISENNKMNVTNVLVKMPLIPFSDIAAFSPENAPTAAATPGVIILAEKELIKIKITDLNKSKINKKPVKENTLILTTKEGLKIKQSQEKLNSRFSITTFISPEFAWYHLQDADGGSGNHEDADDLEKQEKHKFSSTVGFVVDYSLNKHWSLQGGINFSNTNITLEPKLIYARPDNNGSIKYRINTSSGYGYILPAYSSNPAEGDSLYTFSSLHSLQYIGLPLAVTYSINRGRIKYTAMAGMCVNLLTKAKLETAVSQGNDRSNEIINNLIGVKKIYFNGLAGAGIAYSLTNKLALTFIPTLRFALSTINKDASVNSYPMSFGLSSGLKVTL